MLNRYTIWPIQMCVDCDVVDDVIAGDRLAAICRHIWLVDTEIECCIVHWAVSRSTFHGGVSRANYTRESECVPQEERWHRGEVR